MNIAHLEHLQDSEAHHQMSALHFDHLEARAVRLDDPKAAKRFATIARHHRRAAENLKRDIATAKDRAFNPLTVTNYLTGAAQ